MTKFRTDIQLASQQQNQLDYSSKVLLLGSCFSENMGKQLAYYKFNTAINPFGVLFSPTAISKVIEHTISQKKINIDDLVEQGGLYHSFQHHSDLSGVDANKVIDGIHKAQQVCLASLKEASHVVITLGTSWVYKFKKTGQFVANCHKVPQTEFEKINLSVSEIENALIDIIQNIRKVNSSTQIIFTLSPVRHLKDGMLENSLSKAQLLSAIYQVEKSDNVSYFGSYEILMDDLRDYRFYEADMIHPNNVAIDYIWEQFSKVWIDEKASSYFKRIASVQQSKLHKPFQPDSIAHQEFLKKLAIKQKQIEKELDVKF